VSVSDTALVIMAGGLGTRFGGVKQLAEVGPAGEAILDFTIRDAHSAGVERIVVIARSDIDDDLRRHLRRHHGSGLDLEVVHQDAFGPARARPWGTGHAAAAAATLLDGPALVLNADDYYGPTGVERVAVAVAADRTRAVMLGFPLAATLPASGLVSRGVCRLGSDGLLDGLLETHGIGWSGATVTASDPPGVLDPAVPVSMNIWGLPRHAVDRLVGQWEEFHGRHPEDQMVEFLLPEALDHQRREGSLEILVLPTDEEWIGMTNSEDLEAVRAAFAAR
jgi:CTP:molybdopterin cytidylyltransferase MocA